jgi:ATP-binding cassette, subfamily C, bacterial CydC
MTDPISASGETGAAPTAVRADSAAGPALVDGDTVAGPALVDGDTVAVPAVVGGAVAVPVVRWRLRAVAAVGVATLTELAGLALLGTAVWLITRAAQQPPIIALSLAIVAVRAFATGRGVLRYLERLVSHDAVLRVLAQLRTRVFAGLARDPAATPRGDALTRLVSDVDAVQDALLRCALPALVGALVTVATVGVTAAFSVPAGLLVAAGMLAAGLLLPLAGYRLTVSAARRLAPARAAYAGAALDALDGAADLAAYGATPAALARADSDGARLGRLERAAGRSANAVGALGALLPGVTALAVLVVVTNSGLAATMVAVLPLLALAAVEVLLPLHAAAARYAELRTSLARIRPLLDAPVALEPVGDDAAPTGPVEIALAGVTVRYPGRTGAALSDVDIAVPAGRRLAVVGPSGSGKSTLLCVLAGQVAPQAGTVRLTGGADDPAQRWRLATGVLADAHVFHTTVRENLTLGRPGLDDDALLAALAVAGLDPAELPLGRVVGEDGASLSGGERRRLLVARALLRVPPVLLLDEPTEGLDPAAADSLVARLLERAGPASVVLVTHRLVDLSGFDELLVLDAGRVVQRGSHADLLAEPGWYARWCAAARLAEPGWTGTAAG